jgi:hypothetical protein
MTDRTKPDAETRAAEREEAKAPHTPDREPTGDEAEAADAHQPDPEVATHEREMAERGKDQKGEGRI